MAAVLGAPAIGDITAQDRAGDARPAIDQPEPQPGFTRGQPVRALEEDRDPGHLAVGEEGRGRTCRHQQDEGARAEHCLERGLHRHLFGRLLRTGLHHPGAAGVLQIGEDDHGQRNAGKPDDQEGVAPPDRIGKQAADQHAQQRADGDAERVEGQRGGALGGFDHIRDQRMRRRRATRLAHAHANPRQQQLDEILRQSAQGSHGRPDRQRTADQPWPVGGRAIRETRDRQAQDRVEQCEGQARHQADLRIAQTQFEPDRLGQDVDDLPIDEIEDVNYQKDPQGNPDRSTSLPCCRSRHYNLSRSTGMPVTFK